MLVVSNTSPIMNLAVLGLLDLLRQQFREVIVPDAVIEELRLDTDFPGTENIRRALALQLKANLILMDERDGRSLAKSMGLTPIGVLGVLIRAKQDGKVGSVGEILNRLRSEAGFYISNDLMQNILLEIGE